MEYKDKQGDEDVSKEVRNMPSQRHDPDEVIEPEIVEDKPHPSSHLMLEAYSMPEIKGLELLKKAGSTVEVGKTIKEMFSSIQSMESQLNRVLSINATLERDLKASKEVISDLKVVQTRLEQTVVDLEEGIPSKNELQAEIDHLIEEINSVQPQLREMKIEVAHMKDEVVAGKTRVDELEEEKSDLLKEITFLEAKLSAAREEVRAYDKENTTLKGERLIHVKTINGLEKNSMEFQRERGRLMSELKDSKDALNEIHSRLAESKVKAKRSFYGADAEEPGSE